MFNLYLLIFQLLVPIFISDSTERRGHRAKTQIKVKQLYFEAYQKIAIGEGDAIA